MFSDFHIHTSFSGDSKTPPEEQIEAAISLGMDEICITDHHDYATGHMTPIDFSLDIPAYLPAMGRLRETYAGRIRVFTGIELGLQLRHRDYLTRLESGLDVDFIIGSSHFVDEYDVYDSRYYQDKTEHQAYEHYFEATLKRVQSMDCFDCLGHLDYVIRYGPEKNRNYRPADYMDILDEILKTVIRKGKGIECNTAGFKYGLGHPHPYEEILTRYRELGGEILTVGSDGHRPGEVGGAFGQAEEIIKGCGYRYYTVFHERKPEFIKIE